ncbi:MAG: thioredoxin family protein [Candidatus Thiodiazotropha taylori]|nr:thioredoxin family protein [Candidatus Thiodiazotropha taylori]MCG8108609.1 thioredoxin family protein [Candidatus Thiodiazotropha taylori]MCG8110532.1 thioredoxin family protein [Candidatus Thiodiazotropha taylori]MCG8125373.1 thioredoxin family protein [Candidatus Thiodiazotropha taylori]MCW4254122.1 thioredoxin family protein [Candidatus Thiodiazotropha taylori]
MTKIFGFILFLAATAAVADPPEGYPFLPFDKAMAQANTESKLMFVYFGRYGCGYCDKTNKEAFSDPGVKQDYSKNYVLAYVDAESGKRLRLPSGERITERELGTRYNAFVTPIFSFMSPDGKIITRMVGVQRVEDLVDAHTRVQQALIKAGSS